ncbi:hypothetical protein K470DRAFT_255004 [Piedraia hortae CBS 480.64]|uniref:Glycerophosphocholine acyltransferase 1 n=1 Tax=Piedraia hortae CBS 480.64 TaxID=1314780 RepID=A0A6A7C6W9_9PEZI|nr:hypothetical protein K470DRAFT_255004 [Piedraia hortae CBS 480.64]
MDDSESRKRENSDYLSVDGSNDGLSTPSLDRSSSTNSDGGFEEFGERVFPPLERLTIFDILENLALPQRLERMQQAMQNQAEKVRRQRTKLTERALSSTNILVGELRKRGVPEEDLKLEKYRQRVKNSVERLSRTWNDAKTVTLKEKITFTLAVMNLIISAYMLGAFPQNFHYWYTAQVLVLIPLRWYKYRQIGFHYFVADLCYFVNVLLLLSIWFFPQSKRLFISVFCLAMGNNAVAIPMWRNSVVFHSLDKVTSVFIHFMPCATLHCIVHLLPVTLQQVRFPAVHTIKYSPPTAPEHYRLKDMILWATLPYAIWQLSYHILITVRKRDKIAAGRPTSFTWLRRSYKNTFLGKLVLSCPEKAQEPAFMAIQYLYALTTILPCPLWFSSLHASGAFLLIVFAWASWNGATYYIDIFGKRLERELETLRVEVARLNGALEGGSRDASRGRKEGKEGVEGM